MKYVVDTHVIIWYLGNHASLSAEAGRILHDPASELVIPATALAEVFWIIEHKPNKVAGVTIADVKEALDDDARISIYPLDRQVIEKSTELTAIAEMHDRHIAATVILLIEAGQSASLITRDNNITDSGLVPILW
jgi:PIN domain nuclease of toxin-antitoxin system